MRIKNSIDFGLSIRKSRKAQGLRQKDLADFTGCGERFIVELENGKPTCQLDKALAVAQLLGITITAKLPQQGRADE